MLNEPIAVGGPGTFNTHGNCLEVVTVASPKAIYLTTGFLCSLEPSLGLTGSGSHSAFPLQRALHFSLFPVAASSEI